MWEREGERQGGGLGMGERWMSACIWVRVRVRVRVNGSCAGEESQRGNGNLEQCILCPGYLVCVYISKYRRFEMLLKRHGFRTRGTSLHRYTQLGVNQANLRGTYFKVEKQRFVLSIVCLPKKKHIILLFIYLKSKI